MFKLGALLVAGTFAKDYAIDFTKEGKMEKFKGQTLDLDVGDRVRVSLNSVPGGHQWFVNDIEALNPDGIFKASKCTLPKPPAKDGPMMLIGGPQKVCVWLEFTEAGEDTLHFVNAREWEHENMHESEKEFLAAGKNFSFSARVAAPAKAAAKAKTVVTKTESGDSSSSTTTVTTTTVTTSTTPTKKVVEKTITVGGDKASLSPAPKEEKVVVKKVVDKKPLLGADKSALPPQFRDVEKVETVEKKIIKIDPTATLMIDPVEKEVKTTKVVEKKIVEPSKPPQVLTIKPVKEDEAKSTKTVTKTTTTVTKVEKIEAPTEQVVTKIEKIEAPTKTVTKIEKIEAPTKKVTKIEKIEAPEEVILGKDTITPIFHESKIIEGESISIEEITIPEEKKPNPTFEVQIDPVEEEEEPEETAEEDPEEDAEEADPEEEDEPVEA